MSGNEHPGFEALDRLFEEVLIGQSEAHSDAEKGDTTARNEEEPAKALDETSSAKPRADASSDFRWRSARSLSKWTIRLAYGGTIFGLAILGVNKGYDWFAVSLAAPECREKAPLMPEGILGGILVTKSSRNDDRTALVFQVLEDGLPRQDVHVGMICHDAADGGKKADHTSTENAVSILRRDSGASLILSVDDMGKGRIRVNFWRARNSVEEKTARYYDLNEPLDRRRFVAEAGEMIFHTIRDGIAAPLPMPTYPRPSVLSGDEARRRDAFFTDSKLRRLLALPLSPQVLCDIEVQLARSEFETKQFSLAKASFAAIALRKDCSDTARFIAYSFHAHSCVELRDLSCADTSYGSALEIGGGQPPLHILTVTNNRSYVRFGRANGENDPVALRGAIDDHRKVGAGISELPLDAPVPELQHAHRRLNLDNEYGKGVLRRHEDERFDARLRENADAIAALTAKYGILEVKSKQQGLQIGRLSQENDGLKRAEEERIAYERERASKILEHTGKELTSVQNSISHFGDTQRSLEMMFLYPSTPLASFGSDESARRVPVKKREHSPSVAGGTKGTIMCQNPGARANRDCVVKFPQIAPRRYRLMPTT